MKIVFVTLTMLVTLFATQAQKKMLTEKDSPHAIFDCLEAQFSKDRTSEKNQLPYKEIIVIDNRTDTSKSGYWHSRKHNRLMKLCFNGSFEKNVSSFINTYLKSNFDSSGNSVMACIKKCWINTDKSPGSYKAILKVEFYSKTDSLYYPLYRFENSSFQDVEKSTEPNDYIEHLLITSLGKLYHPKAISASSKGLSYPQIDSFNHLIERLPVLHEKVAAKGVYLSFNQFKNNQPIYKDFEIDMGERTDAVFVKGKNLKDSVITDAWGFSDGENVFVRIKTNFFPLFRRGNTFDLYGFDKLTESILFEGGKHPTTMYGNTASGAIDMGVQALMGMIKTKSKNLKPYQLNMETGELY